MSRIKEWLLSEGISLFDIEDPFEFSVRRRILKELDEKFAKGEIDMTYEVIQLIAILKNGGSVCHVCGFHIFDDCICRE